MVDTFLGDGLIPRREFIYSAITVMFNMLMSLRHGVPSSVPCSSAIWPTMHLHVYYAGSGQSVALSGQ